MRVCNNTDAKHLVFKLFGERAKQSITAIEKIGQKFIVYLNYVPPEKDLPDGVVVSRDGDRTIITIEKREVEV